MDTAPKFGIWKFKPRVLQRLGTVRYFAAFLALFGFVVGILPMYSVSQITSLEKHFGLSSQQAGTIVASSEIGCLATSLITGHFFSPLHRPRIIGICALLTSLSCYFMTVPFLMHRTDSQNQRTTIGYVNTDVSLCGVRPDCVGADSPTDGFAYYCFIICTILSGIGSTGFYTLGISYVDDNSSEKMAPTHIGYILSLRYVAPAIGLLLGSATATVPVHFETATTTGDLDYVGAWWMGYYVIGTLALASGLPIMMFPKRLSTTRSRHESSTTTNRIEMNNRTDSTTSDDAAATTVDNRTTHDQNTNEESDVLRDDDDGRKLSETQVPAPRRDPSLPTTTSLIKDFPKALYRLLSRPAFVLLAFSMTMDICGMVGFVAFAPKYIESQFDADPATANFIIGLAIPAACSFGIMVSGKIMSQSDKNLRQKLLASIITMLLAYASFPMLLAFKCPKIEIQEYDLASDCNQHCDCAAKDFTTICGSDGLTYYSPCHAGCTDFNQEIFTQCTCVLGNRTATKGHCTAPCNYGQIIGYATVQFVINFISTVATMPVIMLSLRIVKPSDKSLSLAVINVIASAFIFPTPILFGALIDSACTLHFPEDACSASVGACAYYEKDKFRFVLHLLGTGLKMASPLLLLCAWFATRNTNLNANVASRRDENESTPL